MSKSYRFSVGERVAWYEGNEDKDWKRRTGTVIAADNGLLTILWDKDSTHYRAHPMQCRRLRAKPKPQEPERVERWIVRGDYKKALASNTHAYLSKEEYINGVKLVELREGESICPKGSVAVTRESLVKAWDGEYPHAFTRAEASAHFIRMCESLGLAAQGKAEK